MQRQRGFTLLELLVVLAIIGVVMAGVSLSLRDTQHTQLEREAQRLVAKLEAARVKSRTSGVALVWRTTPEGFVIDSAPASTGALPELWLNPSTQARIDSTRTTADSPPTNAVVLGPEPILAPAHITLSVGDANTQTPRRLSVGTDGLRPFAVVP